MSAGDGGGFEFVSVADFGLARAADLLARGFADYFVRIPFTRGSLLQLARCDSVDLEASRVILGNAAPAGAVLIARRSWTSRVAGMAIVPEARRQGSGRAVMRRVIEEAKARGERAMWLEVIEQNEAAVKLYASCGFEKVRRLVGFSASVSAPPAPASIDGGPSSREAFAATIEKVDLREVAAEVTKRTSADLPWQLSGETIAHLAPPNVAFRTSAAWIALSDPNAATLTVRALVAEGSDAGTDLLCATMAKFPGREWRASAVWPEAMTASFTAAGWQRTALAQWQMRCALA